MKLKLERPLVVFDLETTGTQVADDRIVEISLLKILPNGNQESLTYRVNPTVPIPQSASAVHGITDADVADKPTFAELAPRLKQFLTDCDLAGFNSIRFDIPLLVEEFYRANIELDLSNRKMVDAQVIFHRMEERTLSAAYKFYCNGDLTDAHAAEADVRATFEVIEAQLERYPSLGTEVSGLHEFSTRGNKFVDFAGHVVLNDKGEPTINFGKHKGKTVAEVFTREPSYYSWMMEAKFPQYTKKVITELKLKLA